MGIYSYNPYKASDAYNVGAYGQAGSHTPESQANANLQSNPNSPSSGNAPHQAFGDMAQHWASTLKSYMQPAQAPAPQAPAPSPANLQPGRANQWDAWSGHGDTSTPALAPTPVPAPQFTFQPAPIRALATDGNGPATDPFNNGGTPAPPVTPPAQTAPTPAPDQAVITREAPSNGSAPAPAQAVLDRTPGKDIPTGSGTPQQQPWSADNPPPKPSDADMADSEIAAAWYRKFAYVNPAFANITAADVAAYRGNPLGMSISEWYLAGHRAGEQPAGDNSGTGTGTGAGTGVGTGNNAGTGTGTGTGAGAGTGVGTGTGTNTSTSASATSASTPDPWAFNGPPDPQMSNDISKTIHDRFANLWNQERTDYSREMNAQMARTGDINSGGAGEVYGRGLSRLMSQESGQEAQFIQQANESTLNRNMELYGVKSNAQLQTFLAKNQDLLERYKAALAEKGIEYSADRGVDAAALHAAAASAAAAMGLEGAKYAATLDANTRDLLSQRQYDLGVYGLNQDTYKAQLDDRYKQQYLQWIMSPEYRLSQPPLIFPGNVGVP